MMPTSKLDMKTALRKLDKKAVLRVTHLCVEESVSVVAEARYDILVLVQL